jgi:hypothetical protein
MRFLAYSYELLCIRFNYVYRSVYKSFFCGIYDLYSKDCEDRKDAGLLF